jgi:6-pyruvoyltetrahydropterin/6-carboxytetrahydropterin synthase
LGFRFVFQSDRLDDRNWVYDFGDTKWILEYLREAFDHTTAVAADDPHLELFKQMDEAGALTLRIFSAVGCEKFAEIVYTDVAPQVASMTKNRVRLKSVEVFEHGANSAIYEG